MTTGDELNGRINIGNPGEFTMLRLANLILELSGANSDIQMLPLLLDSNLR